MDSCRWRERDAGAARATSAGDRPGGADRRVVCGAGLLAKTILALDGPSAGFDQRGMLTMEVQVPTTRYNAERRTAFFRQAIEALQALPGVEGAAAANSLAVIGGARGGSWFHRLGTPMLPEPGAPGDDDSRCHARILPGDWRADVARPRIRGSRRRVKAGVYREQSVCRQVSQRCRSAERPR